MSLVNILAVELRHELPGKTGKEYLEAAESLLETIDEYQAAAPETVLQRQAREKLAAIKKRVDYWRPKRGSLTVNGIEVFDLMEQAGLILPP